MCTVTTNQSTKLQESRRALLFSRDSIYLGGPHSAAMRSLVKWKQEGQGNMLVNASPYYITGVKEPRPAILSAVLQISFDNFQFPQDSSWDSSSAFTSSQDQFIPFFTGQMPKSDIFKKDFYITIDNLTWFQDLIMTPGVKERRGLILGEEQGSGQEHIVFHNKSLVKTHRVDPIAVYDVHGDIIAPNEYHKQLQNALVTIRFTLKHWTIGDAKTASDVYTADLQQLSVIEPPPPTVSQKKRVVHAVHPNFLTRKRRTN